MLKIKRVYEKRSAADGKRIYIDRLWPRGLTKEEASFDEWLKDLAPSDDLRRWFGHQPEKFREFRQRYFQELSQPEPHAQLKEIAETANKSDVTLLYSAKDTEHNDAVVLAEVIGKLMREK